MSKIRAAIVGTGAVAANHIEAFNSEKERVELVAAMNPDAGKAQDFCRLHHIPHGYDSLTEMLAAEDLHLVHICSPPKVHLAQCIECLEAGVHVLCEKPMVASLDEQDQLQAAEARSGRYCSSVFQLRFGSGVQHLKNLIAAGTLGQPLLGICNTTWFRTADYYAVPWRGKWHTEVGGVSLVMGIHLVDLLLWLYGPWQEVRAIMTTLERDIEVENISMAHVRFESGAAASIVNSALSPRQETYLRLDFQKATVELRYLYFYDNSHWTFTAAPDVPESELASWDQIARDVRAHHSAQLTSLLDDIAHNRRPLTSGTEARNTLEFITSLYKSALTDRPIQRGSITPDDPFYRHMQGKPSTDSR